MKKFGWVVKLPGVLLTIGSLIFCPKISAQSLSIHCPPPVTVPCFFDVPPPNTLMVEFNSSCGGVIVTWEGDVESNEICPNKVVITRTYRVINNCGLVLFCNQTITVFDNIPPLIICPLPVTVKCRSQVPAPNFAGGFAIDNCHGVFVNWEGDDISENFCKNRLNITRTYRASDGCGNESYCTQLITVYDDIPPVITCPPPVTVKCAADVPLPDFAGGTATDNCGIPVVSFDGDEITNQTCANNYTINRNYKAVDDCGNESNCTQVITVHDDIPPIINCPPPVTVKGAAHVPLHDFAGGTATDNCGVPVVSFDGDEIVNGICPASYTINRNYKAVDACGNETNCTQVITVLDDIPPIITCPPPVTVKCSAAVPAHNFAGGTATDNCGVPVVSFEGDQISDQTCANSYIITRSYKAVDVFGNEANCTQIITVHDDIVPVITCPPPVTVKCAGEVPAHDFAGGNASDNCGPVTITWLGDEISGVICLNKYTISRSYKATDACGNEAHCVQIITINDDIPPVITCPPDITVQCPGDVPAPDVFSFPVSDNCGGVIFVAFISDVISNQTCPNRYKITRTYRARDICNNISFCTQIITVLDNTPPVFYASPSITIPFTTTCGYSIPAPAVYDNCPGQVSLTWIDSGPVQCGNELHIIRTWYALDVCGNISSFVQTITVTDNNTDYIIYASKEAKFGEDNTINGNVGVTDANGKADFKKGSVLDPNHVYAKNITVQLPATVNNKHFVPATGGPSPTFYFYAGGGLAGNYTQSVNGVVPAGNYKNLTIKKNIIATVNGSNYGKITIEEGAKVTFTSSNINMEELTVGKGKKGVTTSNVYFTGCTGVKIKDRVTIEEDTRINILGPKVIFYLGDTKKDEENFLVKGDNSQITLNIMIPNGKLKIDKKTDDCIMTGWFIIEKLESTGSTTWNPYDCGPLSARGPVTRVNINKAAAEDDFRETFKVTVSPNPSTADFRIQVKSMSEEPVSIRIYDVTGRTIRVINNAAINSYISVGSELRQGSYFAEVQQGTNRQTVKLLKME